MDKKAVRADLLMMLTAGIWGFAFAAQRAGMDFVGPFTYNGIRFLLGSAFLVPFIFFAEQKKRQKQNQNKPCNCKDLRGVAEKRLRSKPLERGGQCPPHETKTWIFSSLLLGTCLWAASSLQQLGIFWVNAGESGFITGIYVVLVPIFGIFLGRKTGVPTWIGAFLALCGIFFITGADSLFFSAGARANLPENTPVIGYVLTIIGGIFWTFHVLLVDILVKKTDAVKLACGQFAVCGALAFLFAFTGISAKIGVNAGAEIGSALFSFDDLMRGAVPILYGGLCSVGIAYTLQVVAQKDAPPAHASIILSSESIFAALGGILLLHEVPAPLAFLGFTLMLLGMIATQWDIIRGH
ncbi:MAG: DMT family transporter [Spirochaetaceae bacterium]|jgi:drug/metabolite transporter (DMT)-like permease|nr:DMT family transporter [Spirochaetaceae bacterium]